MPTIFILKRKSLHQRFINPIGLRWFLSIHYNNELISEVEIFKKLTAEHILHGDSHNTNVNLLLACCVQC